MRDSYLAIDRIGRVKVPSGFDKIVELLGNVDCPPEMSGATSGAGVWVSGADSLPAM